MLQLSFGSSFVIKSQPHLAFECLYFRGIFLDGTLITIKGDMNFLHCKEASSISNCEVLLQLLWKTELGRTPETGIHLHALHKLSIVPLLLLEGSEHNIIFYFCKCSDVT